jgi:hypothetical protein
MKLTTRFGTFRPTIDSDIWKRQTWTLDTSISLFVSKPEASSARQQRARIGGLDRSGPMRPQE